VTYENNLTGVIRTGKIKNKFFFFEEKKKMKIFFKKES
jgi:hypothetical protein